MNLLLWIVFGALVGWVASIIMKTNRSQGFVMDIILGVVGAFVGGLIASLFGQPGVEGFDLYSFAIALLGSVVVVWLGRRLAA